MDDDMLVLSAKWGARSDRQAMGGKTLTNRCIESKSKLDENEQGGGMVNKGLASVTLVARTRKEAGLRLGSTLASLIPLLRSHSPLSIFLPSVTNAAGIERFHAAKIE
jgi:hypothetical protein